MKFIPVSRFEDVEGALDARHGQGADEHWDLGLVPLRRRVLLLGRHAPPRLVLVAKLPSIKSSRYFPGNKTILRGNLN